MEYHNNIAQNLEKYREEKNLSVIDLCKQAKVSRSTYYAIQTGSINPTIKLLGRLAKVLNVNVEDML